MLEALRVFPEASLLPGGKRHPRIDPLVRIVRVFVNNEVETVSLSGR